MLYKYFFFQIPLNFLIATATQGTQLGYVAMMKSKNENEKPLRQPVTYQIRSRISKGFCNWSDILDGSIVDFVDFALRFRAIFALGKFPVHN